MSRRFAYVCAALLGCGARSSLETSGTGGASVATDASTSASSGEGGCAPMTLEVGSPGVEYLVTDGERVFYSTRDHRIMAGDLETGATTLLATSTAMSIANAVAAFGDYVYFADDNVVWRVPKSGGEAEALTEPIPQLFNLTADATGIYWTQAGGPSAARDILRLRPDGTRVEIAKAQYGVFGLLPLAEGLVYTTQSTDSAMLIGDVDGGGVKTLVSGLPFPRFAFARDGYVYWVEDTDVTMTSVGAVARAHLDGSGYERVLEEALPAEQTTRAVTDGAHFFAVRVASPNRVVGAAYPHASTVTTLHESPFLVSARSLAVTPKRLVFTISEPASEPSVQSLCLRDLTYD